MIYEHIPERITKRMPIDHCSPIKAWDHWLPRNQAPAWYWHKIVSDMAILRTCRQVHDEARPLIVRALWGPPSSPSLHFSSCGFSVFGMMYEIEGDVKCCEEHPVRRVQGMIARHRCGLVSATQAVYPHTVRIEYSPRPVKNRMSQEVLDLAEDMAVLKILEKRPGYGTHTPGSLDMYSILGKDSVTRMEFEAHQLACRHFVQQNRFSFITGEWPGSYGMFDRIQVILVSRCAPRFWFGLRRNCTWRQFKGDLILLSMAGLLGAVLGILTHIGLPR
jgi:hypothetical protein